MARPPRLKGKRVMQRPPSWPQGILRLTARIGRSGTAEIDRISNRDLADIGLQRETVHERFRHLMPL